MAKRDFVFLRAFGFLLIAAFSPLLLRPGAIPGNFGDIYGYHYPLRHLVASTLQEGRLPLWNPYIFAGTPLAANPQAVLFYPLSLLHYFLPLSWAFSFDAMLHLMLAGFGTYLLMRKWGIDRLGSWILCVSYGLSPFLVYRISQGVPTLLAALAWVPWVWLALISSNVTLLGLAWSLQILSGHGQFTFINGALMGLWVLAARPRQLLLCFSGGLIAVLVTAVQLLPTFEFLNHSVRAYWGLAFSVGYSLRPEYLLTLIYPNAWGNPFQAGFEYPSDFFEMLTNYIGLLPLGLAFLSLRPKNIIWDSRPRGRFRGRSRRAKALWVLAAVGIFFALGDHNPLFVPIQKALGLDFFRIPSRFSFFMIWALIMSAAIGWRDLRASMSPSWRWILAIAATLDMMAWSAPWIYSQDPSEFLASNTKAIHFLRGAGPWRVATSPETPAPNKCMLYRIPNATGYEAFYLFPIAGYTSRSEGKASADGSRTYIRRWDTTEMSRLAVRYYASPIAIANREAAFHEGVAIIYENPAAQPLVQTDDASARWEMKSAGHWTVNLTRQSAVTVSQADYPGWKAWVDGKSIEVRDSNGLFPSISPPYSNHDGPWKIHFRFMPGLWLFGSLTSIFTLLAMAIQWSRNR